MLWLSVFFCLILLLLIVLVSGITPLRSELSLFEMERRQRKGDKQAIEALRQYTLASTIVSMQQVVLALLIIALTLVLIASFGWWFGIFIIVLVALDYASLGKLSFVRRQSERIYHRYEPQILDFAEKYNRGAFRLVTVVTADGEEERRINSRDELLHMVEATSALGEDEKSLLRHGLAFEDIVVREVMTPRSVIKDVSKKEVLGPLVLDDLHKTGHSRFPVIDGDIDHIVGMLYIQDLLVIGDRQRTVTVEKAMEPRVFYIHEDDSLWHALTAFLKTHHHLFIVINEFRETVGILSLEDVIEKLIGKKIVGESDEYDDLRAVAEKTAQKKHAHESGQDV